MLETISSHLFLQTLALTLVHFLWQGLAVACLLKIVFSIFGHQKSQWRYGFSAVAMLANFCLPIITFYTLYQPTHQGLTNSFTLLPIVSFQQDLQANNVLFGYNELVEYLPFLALTWLICVLFLAAKLLLEVYYVRHLPQQRVAQPSKALNDKFMSLVEKVGLWITPRLLISLKVDVPMAIGWLKPVVLIPAKMVTGLSEEQLEMLMLHELAHIKRFDYLVNFLQTLIDILLFFHPCVHWVSKQMRQEREYCSDDIAVSHCGDAIAYAHTLTDTATLCRKHHTATIPGMAMAASGGDLKQRVVRLVHHCSGRQDQSGRWFAGILIIGLVLTITLLPYAKLPVLDLSSGHIQIVRSDSPFNRTISSDITHDLAEQVMPRSLAQQLLFQSNTLENASIFSPTTVVSLKNKIGGIATNHPDIANDGITAAAEPKISKQEKHDTLIQVESTQSVAHKNTINKLEVGIEQISVPSLDTRLDTRNQDSRERKTISTEPMLSSVSSPLPKHTEQLTGYKKIASENKYAKQVSDIASNVNTSQATLFNELNNKPQLHPMLAENTEIQSVETMLSSKISKKNVIEKANSGAKSSIETIDEAELISSFEPRYPAMAKRKGIELDVKVNFTIDVDGKIKDIQFEDQGKLSYFRHAILVAMEKWRFLPARTNGKPIESAMSKIFSFSLVS